MSASGGSKSFQEIQEKIDRGDVVVLTAQEICDRVRQGESFDLADVDVVTTATSALMSGTYAVLSFKVAEPDTFTRAKRVWINSVPAQVGPCPNERIGILDLIVLGTQQSEKDPSYGGGDLFRDLIRGDSVTIEIETDQDQYLTATTTLKRIPHAMLHASRNAFKNYLAFVNPGKSEITTIFHSDNMKGNLEEMSFCGCGELNPLENDPDLKTIGVGTPVLINGAKGYITGPGTRSSRHKPNLAAVADMHDMSPSLLGGFKTGHGPDIITTWAVAIPVLDKELLQHILKTDDQIPLKVVDVRTRIPIGEITYADVWKKGGIKVRFNRDTCRRCEICKIEEICPVRAVTILSDKSVALDHEVCFNCGLCVSRCEGRSFEADLGIVNFHGRNIPVTLRQSNRDRAVLAAEDLKHRIRNRRFPLVPPVGPIRFPD